MRENKGSAGIDGITFEMIEEYGVEEYLLDIQEDLQNKKYRPQPVKRVYCRTANWGRHKERIIFSGFI